MGKENIQSFYDWIMVDINKMSTIVNTLGPMYTDSYRATKYWLEKHNMKNNKIFTHESYECVFKNLKQGEYIVMPTGYIDKKNEMSWVDYHFTYYDQLSFVEVFPLKVMKMIFVENDFYDKEGIVVQPATRKFAVIEKNEGTEKYVYANSKPQALDIFLNESYHYTLCSEPIFKKKKIDFSKFTIKREYEPVMIWIVYRVKKNINLSQ